MCVRETSSCGLLKDAAALALSGGGIGKTQGLPKSKASSTFGAGTNYYNLFSISYPCNCVFIVQRIASV